MTAKKTRKHCGFVIYSYFKHSPFIAVKRDFKGPHLSIKGIQMVGVPFLLKMVFKRGKRLNLGAEPPSIKLC